MIKLPIKYEDFDGNEVTEDHYFHLSKSELIKLESGDGEPISVKLERAGKSGDGGQIMRVMSEVIELSYGQRVDGSGSQFYKDPDLTKLFMGSLAFDQLLTDLLTDATDAVTFVNGLMPSGLAELAAKVSQQGGVDNQKPVQVTPDNLQAAQQLSGLENPFDAVTGEILPWAYREPTSKELTSMPPHQMRAVYARKASDWKPPAAVST